MLVDDPEGALDNIEEAVRLYIRITPDCGLKEYQRKVVDCLLKVADYYKICFKDGIIGTNPGAVKGNSITEEYARRHFVDHHQKTWYKGPGFHAVDRHTTLADLVYWTRDNDEKFFRASLKKCYKVNTKDRAIEQPFSGILIIEEGFSKVYWRKLKRWRDTFMRLNHGCTSVLAHRRGLERKP